MKRFENEVEPMLLLTHVLLQEGVEWVAGGIPDAAEMGRLHQVVHPLAKRLGYANPYGIPGSQTKAPKP